MAAINPGIRVTETKNSCTDKTIFLSSRNCVKSIWNLVNKASLNDEATIASKENDQLTYLLVRGCNLMSTTGNRCLRTQQRLQLRKIPVHQAFMIHYINLNINSVIFQINLTLYFDTNCLLKSLLPLDPFIYIYISFVIRNLIL